MYEQLHTFINCTIVLTPFYKRAAYCAQCPAHCFFHLILYLTDYYESLHIESPHLTVTNSVCNLGMFIIM